MPQPDDIVLLQVTLAGVETEDFDSSEFAEAVEQLVKELGFEEVDVTVYASLEEQDENIV